MSNRQWLAGIARQLRKLVFDVMGGKRRPFSLGAARKLMQKGEIGPGAGEDGFAQRRKQAIISRRAVAAEADDFRDHGIVKRRHVAARLHPAIDADPVTARKTRVPDPARRR
jgi:hypothetical protein